ncbi:putative RNA helicase [Helianthus annuus]|nr:putative RNA helicase [Helianthus annuus]
MALEDLDPQLPRFTGSNPNSWISQSELYFRFYSIYGDERFSYVIEVFDDGPFYWFNSWFRSDDLTWNDFTTAMLHRFSYLSLKPTIDTVVNLSPPLSALQVLDEMPDSIANSINREVVETIDDEVLAIQTESMVGVVDSKVIHYFAWKPGWVEHNVQGLEHSILLPPASSVTTASTNSVASVAGIPSKQDSLLLQMGDHIQHQTDYFETLNPTPSTFFLSNPDVVSTEVTVSTATDSFEIEKGSVQQPQQGITSDLELDPLTSILVAAPIHSVTTKYTTLLSTLNLDPKFVHVSSGNTTISADGTSTFTLNRPAMVIDCLLLPLNAKVHRMNLGFDPGPYLHHTPYSTHNIIMLQHIGLALYEFRVSNDRAGINDPPLGSVNYAQKLFGEMSTNCRLIDAALKNDLQQLKPALFMLGPHLPFDASQVSVATPSFPLAVKWFNSTSDHVYHQFSSWLTKTIVLDDIISGWYGNHVCEIRPGRLHKCSQTFLAKILIQYQVGFPFGFMSITTRRADGIHLMEFPMTHISNRIVVPVISSWAHTLCYLWFNFSSIQMLRMVVHGIMFDLTIEFPWKHPWCCFCSVCNQSVHCYVRNLVVVTRQEITSPALLESTATLVPSFLVWGCIHGVMQTPTTNCVMGHLVQYLLTIGEMFASFTQASHSFIGPVVELNFQQLYPYLFVYDHMGYKAVTTDILMPTSLTILFLEVLLTWVNLYKNPPMEEPVLGTNESDSNFAFFTQSAVNAILLLDSYVIRMIQWLRVVVVLINHAQIVVIKSLGAVRELEDNFGYQLANNASCRFFKYHVLPATQNFQPVIVSDFLSQGSLEDTLQEGKKNSTFGFSRYVFVGVAETLVCIRHVPYTWPHLISVLTHFHGDTYQSSIIEILQKIKSGTSHVLVATNVAWGLALKLVINFDIESVVNFDALFGHTPPALVGSLHDYHVHVTLETELLVRAIMVILITPQFITSSTRTACIEDGFLDRTHQLLHSFIALHLEDKVYLKRGSNVMNCIGYHEPNLAARLRSPTREWICGNVEGNLAGYNIGFFIVQGIMTNMISVCLLPHLYSL